jgi:hypothetical protein
MAVLRFILALIVTVVPVLLVQVVFSVLGLGKFAAHVLAALVSIPACYLAYYAYVRFVEKRAVTEFAVQGALSIIFESGVLLAAAFVVTRRLWFPIGMHFAWNFTQGGIFGVAVSGGAASGLFRGQLSGPACFPEERSGPKAP